MFWSANLTVCKCVNITNAFTIPSSPQFLDQVCTFRVPIATESSAAADHFHRAPHATRQTMSFAVSASATRVVASARAFVQLLLLGLVLQWVFDAGGIDLDASRDEVLQMITNHLVRQT